MQRHDKERLQKAILSHVRTDVPSLGKGCWYWVGPVARSARGLPHGYFTFEGRRYTARRTSWMVFRGEVPTCRLRTICGHSLCVNPQHLEQTAIKASKGRPKRCPR